MRRKSSTEIKKLNEAKRIAGVDDDIIMTDYGERLTYAIVHQLGWEWDAISGEWLPPVRDDNGL